MELKVFWSHTEHFEVQKIYDFQIAKVDTSKSRTRITIFISKLLISDKALDKKFI